MWVFMLRCLLAILPWVLLVHTEITNETEQENIALMDSKNSDDSSSSDELIGTCSYLVYKHHFLQNTCPLDENYIFSRFKKLRKRCLHNLNSSRLSIDHAVVLNFTTFIKTLEERHETACSVVLFYAKWCPFSMKISPSFNALGRIFTNLDFFAVDVSETNSFLTRYGTVGVPTVMITEGTRLFARYNSPNITVPAIAEFITNQTNLVVPVVNNSSLDVVLQITPEDHIGPVPSEPSNDPNWALVASIIFLILYLCQHFLIAKWHQYFPIFENIFR
ncbi:thioredoxin domain-containing protein 15-like isoform X1 [Styela clava]